MSPSFRTFSSLKFPTYRVYLGMYLSQMMAMDMRSLAQSLLIYRLTGSVAILGVMALVNAVPGILLPLFGGVIADRLPKKNVVVMGQVGSMLTSLIIAVSLTFGFLSAERTGSYWILMLASFINYASSGLSGPSRHAIVAELFGTDQVMNAISLRSTGYNIIHLGAPALAGLLIDVLDFEIVFYITTSLGILALILSVLLPNTGKGEENGGSVFSQMKDGLKYVRGETSILFVLVFTMLAAILATPVSRLMPVFVDDILKVGAKGMGVLLSATAIGALVSSLAMASLPNKRRGTLLLGASVVLGVVIAFFAFSRSWHLSLALMAMVGLARTVRTTMSNTLLQSYTAPNYRGRVMSLYAMEDGVTSLGGFVAAMVAGVIGVQWVVGSFALVLILLSIMTIVLIPRIRKLE
ncbi:MAG: MFS transporter [Chloroflexota bacterium]